MATYQYPLLFHRQRLNPLLLRTTLCSDFNNKQSSSSSTTIKIPGSNSPQVNFKTFGPCKLGISRFPDFDYNADGGSGFGSAKPGPADGEVLVEFDVERLFIPPLSSTTTRFLGLPLPPFLKIDIAPELLRGTIDPKTGKVDLMFRARFCFTAGDIYKPPPLLVETNLTSEKPKGNIREGQGKRLDDEGNCKLVGVARVESIDDAFLNTFLSLPTECIAVLNARITFSTEEQIED